MAEIPIQRVNFFDGQFLKQGEFNDLSTYMVHLRRRLLFVLFNQSGVVQASPQDLTIEVPNPAQKVIRVKAGMAIGMRPDLAEAKEIILGQDTLPIDLTTLQPPLQANDIGIVTVNYDEEGVAVPPSEGDVPGNTRINEKAIIAVHRNSLPSPNAQNGEPFIQLGNINFNTMSVDTTQRQRAFLQGSLIAATSQISLSPNTVPAAGNVSITVTSSGLNLSGATVGSVVISDMAGITNVAVSNQQPTSMTLRFTLTNAAAGARNVTISVNNVSASTSFTVLAGLTLTSFAGVNEPANDLLFKINGTGFAPPVIVEFSASGGGFAAAIALPPPNVAATQVTIPSASIPPDATVGPVRVQSGGNPPMISGFNVTPPPIVTNVPSAAQTQTNITITGSRFFTGTAVILPGNQSRGPNSATPFPAATFGESLTQTQIVVRVTSNSNTAARVQVVTEGGTVLSATVLAVN